MEEFQHELKKEFQLERMILFSDAVFAIAITLLVIEIKVPELHEELSDHLLGHELLHLVPKFSGFLISFFIIGLYWTIHHQMFGFVVNYDRKLLWINLFFLMSIVLMPFSSGLYGEYSVPGAIYMLLPYGIYVANILFSGIMTYALWNYLTKPGRKLTEGIPSATYVRLAKARSLLVSFIFLLSFLVTIWNPVVGRFVPGLIP
ncbi:MAG: TMEM175 family protein, partial [Saprospiraceae bacterium]